MPSKIGVIFCCYGNPEYVEPCLKPWLALKDKYNIKIAGVHGQFKEFNEKDGLHYDNDHETLDLLEEKYYFKDLIDYLYIQNRYDDLGTGCLIHYGTEAEIRNYGLEYLLKENVEFVLMLDNDEIYTEQEIENLISYINKEDNQFYAVFKIEFKNLTFSDKTYTKGFCPQRIWRVDLGDYRLSEVNYDNDCLYEHKLTGANKSDKEFSNKSIPKNLVNPIHHSWDDYERSSKKIIYQLKRWSPPNGNGCSFKINEEKKCIEWDMEYFNRIGQTPPIIFEL